MVLGVDCARLEYVVRIYFAGTTTAFPAPAPPSVSPTLIFLPPTPSILTPPPLTSHTALSVLTPEGYTWRAPLVPNSPSTSDDIPNCPASTATPRDTPRCPASGRSSLTFNFETPTETVGLTVPVGIRSRSQGRGSGCWAFGMSPDVEGLMGDLPSLPTPPSPSLLQRVTPGELPSYPARSSICACKTHADHYSPISPSTSSDTASSGIGNATAAETGLSHAERDMRVMVKKALILTSYLEASILSEKLVFSAMSSAEAALTLTAS
ncbi:hypothetical protein BU17DRAFT_80631 [Hysterangium stoloniferum]|nr:hypothetical protein BU17DRAFT_80631 [Hysterangium stoloniferum]